MTAARNPFEPIPPGSGDLGRLVTVGHLAPDWLCRWCQAALSTTPTKPNLRIVRDQEDR